MTRENRANEAWRGYIRWKAGEILRLLDRAQDSPGVVHACLMLEIRQELEKLQRCERPTGD